MKKGFGGFGQKLDIRTKLGCMEKYECMLCEYTYNPERGDPRNGIPAGTPWDELPEDWVCPKCGTIKENFFLLD
jgi:rubredoxin